MILIYVYVMFGTAIAAADALNGQNEAPDETSLGRLE
jgi:hypothetical protein